MHDPYPSLHQTVRVGLDPANLPEWGGLGTPVGTIEYGIEVPHEAVNLKGRREGSRYVAAPRKVVHEERFKPNTLPAGINMETTQPHICDNHIELGPAKAKASGYYLRGAKRAALQKDRVPASMALYWGDEESSDSQN